MSEPVTFEVVFEQREVEIKDKDGKKQTYIIREMTGQEKAKYFQRARHKSKLTESGDVVVEDYDGMFTDLLSLSMATPDGKLIDQKTLEQWPASLLTKLTKISQQLNALTVQDAEKMIAEAKND